MKTIEQIIEELDSKIPRDAVSERDAGNGRSLSYLEGWYVIDRLNKVLGQGNWSYESEAQLVHSGTIQQRSGEAHSVHYLAKVTLAVSFGDKIVTFRDYGYGDGTDRHNPGKAHELAVKESITDGLKRCAKNLGMSMGLALYSKEQENVQDEPEPAANKPETATKATPKEQGAPKASSETVKAPTSRNTLEETIRSYVRVAEKQKKLTGDQFKEHLLKEFNKGFLKDLDETQLNKTLSYLQALTK